MFGYFGANRRKQTRWKSCPDKPFSLDRVERLNFQGKCRGQ